MVSDWLIDLLLRILLVGSGVVAVVAGLGWLVGCAAAYRWLTFREWWDGGR